MWVQSHIVLLVVAFLLGFRALAVLVEDKPESFHLYGLAVLLAAAVGLYFLPTAFLRALVRHWRWRCTRNGMRNRTRAIRWFCSRGVARWAGYVVQGVLTLLGLAGPLARLFVQYQGDTSAFAKEQLMTNWPGFVFLIPDHLGWILGLVIGIFGVFLLVWGISRRRLVVCAYGGGRPDRFPAVAGTWESCSSLGWRFADDATTG